jgi:hypothetical protein
MVDLPISQYFIWKFSYIAKLKEFYHEHLFIFISFHLFIPQPIHYPILFLMHFEVYYRLSTFDFKQNKTKTYSPFQVNNC